MTPKSTPSTRGQSSFICTCCFSYTSVLNSYVLTPHSNNSIYSQHINTSVCIQPCLLITSLYSHNSLGSHAYLLSQLVFSDEPSSLTLLVISLNPLFNPASFLRQSYIFCQAHRQYQSLFSSSCLLNFTVPLETSTSFIHPSFCISLTFSQPLSCSQTFISQFHPQRSKVHLYLCIVVLQKSKHLIRRQCNCGCLVFSLSTKGKRSTLSTDSKEMHRTKC